MEQRVGKALSIDELKVPPILYKYRDYREKNHKKSLFDAELFVPSASQLNDPYDSKIPFRYHDEELTDDNIFLKCLEAAKRQHDGLSEQQYHDIAFKLQSEHLLNDEHHLEEFDKQFYRAICNKGGIFCTTPDSENFLMWSYYSDSHRGFCIGYDSDKLFNTRLFILGGIVDYKNEFPKMPMFGNNDTKLFWDIFYTKWEIWKHENEYRLIHNYEYDRQGKKALFKLPSEVICEVVFGCKFPQEEIAKIYPILIQKYPHVKLSQVKLDKNTFKLEKESFYDPELFLFNSQQVNVNDKKHHKI